MPRGRLTERRGRLGGMHRFVVLLMLAAVIGALAAAPGAPWRTARAEDGPVSMVVEPQLDGSQFVTVVFHALDRDGFCQPPAGAVSLHPVLNMPVDFIIEAGDGIIIETSSGGIAPGRQATGVRTFSTAANAAAGSPVRSFPPLRDGVADECQAWVRISQSIPGPLRVLVLAPGDGGGQVGWVAEAGRETATTVPLQFRWTLVTWTGPATAPAQALQGVSGAQVTAIYGWETASQAWLAYFPAGANVPGANTLTSLEPGKAYWVAIAGPGGGSWRMPSAR
ncbi:MAG: hypothetical protein KatS3mg063_1709 [Tepidiforma sp.]|nr:MAG: hypothetical protein KatS3mg063_1709 [Tepidiforma sp.]